MAFTLTAEATSWQFVEANFTGGTMPGLQLATIQKIEGGSSVDTKAVYGAGAKMFDRTSGQIKIDNVKFDIGPSDWISLYNSILLAALPLAPVYGLLYTGTNGMDLVLSKAGQFGLTVTFQLPESLTLVWVTFANLRVAKVPFTASVGADEVKMSIECTANDVQWGSLGL